LNLLTTFENPLNLLTTFESAYYVPLNLPTTFESACAVAAAENHSKVK